MPFSICGLHSSLSERFVFRSNPENCVIFDVRTYQYLLQKEAHQKSQAEFNEIIQGYYLQTASQQVPVLVGASFSLGGETGRKLFLMFLLFWIHREYITCSCLDPIHLNMDFNLCASGDNVDTISAFLTELISKLNSSKDIFMLVKPCDVDSCKAGNKVPVVIFLDGNGYGEEGKSIRKKLIEYYTPDLMHDYRSSVIQNIRQHAAPCSSPPSSTPSGSKSPASQHDILRWPKLRTFSSTSLNSYGSASSTEQTVVNSPRMQINIELSKMLKDNHVDSDEDLDEITIEFHSDPEAISFDSPSVSCIRFLKSSPTQSKKDSSSPANPLSANSSESSASPAPPIAQIKKSNSQGVFSTQGLQRISILQNKIQDSELIASSSAMTPANIK